MRNKFKKNAILFILSFIIFLLGEKYIGQIGTYERALSWDKVIENIPFYLLLSSIAVIVNILIGNKEKK